MSIYFWKNNKNTIIYACFAALLGVVSALGAQEWWMNSAPLYVKIKSIHIRPIPEFKDRWLDIYLLAVPKSNCVRNSQHMMYRIIPNIDNTGSTTRQYITLGGILAGGGFSSTSGEIETSLRIPYGLAEGEWYYIYRSLYTCNVWPGLSRITRSETPPIKIIIKNSDTQETIQWPQP